MLKHRIDDSIRLIKQPDHAALSGSLAAHWGNDDFTPPGFFASVPDPQALRNEVLFGIGEHDNGWWEWEADPEIDPRDGLPRHFLDTDHAWGHERWRRGVHRFFAKRPYASLLINYHAYWLSDLAPPPEFASFFPPRAANNPDPGIERFLAERRADQLLLEQALRDTANGPAALDPESLHPHVRLLQALDFISLWLCGGASRELAMPEIPRQGWDDRIVLTLRPKSAREITVSPYPFALDPLPAVFVCKQVPADLERRPELITVAPAVVSLTLCSR